MLRLRLISPEGLVFNNRLAKAGDEVDVETALAAELLAKGAAILMIRVRVRREVFIGSRSCRVGDFIDVRPETAQRLVGEGAVSLPSMRVISKSITVDGRTHGTGKLVEVPIEDVVNLIVSGSAVFSGEVTTLPPEKAKP